MLTEEKHFIHLQMYRHEQISDWSWLSFCPEVCQSPSEPNVYLRLFLFLSWRSITGSSSWKPAQSPASTWRRWVLICGEKLRPSSCREWQIQSLVLYVIFLSSAGLFHTGQRHHDETQQENGEFINILSYTLLLCVHCSPAAHIHLGMWIVKCVDCIYMIDR